MTAELTVDEIRASLRDWFAHTPGIAEVRANRDRADGDASHPGFDRATWQRLAEQLGVTGLGAPEAWGGLACDTESLAGVVEECAASLYPGPVRASVLLAAALGGLVPPENASSQMRSGVEAFLGGTAIAGVPGVPGDSPAFADGRVTGRFDAVTHGGSADLLLGEVATELGPAVALVLLSDATTVSRTPRRTVDLATPLADVAVIGAPAAVLVGPADSAGLDAHRRLETILVAAEQVGGAEGALAGMVAYAGVREQFGKLIGTYQAIAHRCADTAVDIAAARALVTAAAAAHDGGDGGAALQLALLARAESADAFTAATDSYIQVSGGIGFTWEHDAHLFFRRARATAAIGGTPAQHRDRAVEAGCLDLLVGAP
ncbi:MAG TPA: acyl-CoA dehydrogenase family protein [Gordonia sp. (in: high G+C Gram-positive bacteria)]|uniref:acyl-CoA dehydrogenase family protein n=1 Tax=unclassified Gordonia (in: high G+C Gram-positive bacteria) TaxID=2657482 RepID=UPI0025B98968|nr:MULTISPECIES: acyl-CoA dehydrogenase family protein [unclassified Gordonia (in: high G+C Gram-positive bacteria)]HNP55345.1 acyl-CoA dehydrogenase family protein [Gordonia sp. (in: high G+C Gram-positive bacteria)]HRC50083.1 acyl-CoA dehydrogenase family protein [Gordonia sp. (in: high G+C Gram-positive bacteria)]